MKRPMLLLSIFLVMGILISYYFRITDTALYILALVGMFWGLVSLSLNNDIWGSILVLVLVLGIFVGNNATTSKLGSYYDQEADFTGTVVSSKIHEDKSTFHLNLSLVNGKAIREKIVVNIYENINLDLGDVVRFNTKLREPNVNTNPYLFNYKKHLLTNKIHYIATIKESSITKIGVSSNLTYRIISNVRFYIENRFDEFLDPQNSSMLKGIILGGGSYLEEDEYAKYRDLGLAHILAVSGLHMGIISGALLFLFSRLGIKRVFSVPLVIILLVIYSYLIGFPPSTTRALLMFSLIYIGKLIFRPIDFLNIIFASMFITLLINPMWIHSTGYLLSYGAIISIGVFGNKVKEIFYPYNNKIISGLSTTIAVSIGILPIQVYNFNAFPIYSFISNILIIPVVTVNVILGFLFVIFKPSHYILNITLNVQSYLVEVFNLLPYKTLSVGVFSAMDILLYFIIIVVWYHLNGFIGIKDHLKKAIMYSLIFLAFVGALSYEKDDSYKVHFIDVGQGDSTLIQGEHSILIDGGGSLFGSFDVGKNITLPYLEKHGVNYLDLVILTHNHEDHYKGLIPVLEKLSIGAMIVNRTSLNDDIMKVINEKKIPFIVGHRDIDINYENINLDFLWPYYKENYRINENNNSLVSKVSIYDKTLLFTGDIEKEAEEKLIKDRLNEVDFLKVAHHGSSTSSTKAFIQLASPKFSIISVGRNNNFGHPNYKTINTLKSENSKIYRTDEMGRILVSLDKDSFDISAYIGPLYKEDLLNALLGKLNLIIYYCIFILFSYIITLIYRRMEESSHELHRIH